MLVTEPHPLITLTSALKEGLEALGSVTVGERKKKVLALFVAGRNRLTIEMIRQVVSNVLSLCGYRIESEPEEASPQLLVVTFADGEGWIRATIAGEYLNQLELFYGFVPLLD